MSVSIKAPDENPSNVESILSDTIGLPGYTINPPGSRIETLLIELNKLIKGGGGGGGSDIYAANLSLTIDSSTYVVTAILKNQNGESIGTPQTIDLPLESVVVGGSYNSQTQKVVLTLQNGNTVEFSVADLVSGLQTEITSVNKLDADLVDDHTSTNKFVTSGEKSTWNGKQNALSSAQLDAVNSGIDATKVTQIATNESNISSILDGTTIDSFEDVESALATKADTLTTYTKTEVDTALSGKQNVIDNSHKLSADNVDDTNATNKFATATELEQIETNKNNISTDEAALVELVDGGAKNILNILTPTTINRMSITDAGNGSVTASCSNVSWANSGYEFSLTAGKTYKFIIYVDSASVSDVQLQCFVNDISGSTAQELARTSRITSPGVYSVDFVATSKIRTSINLNNSATAATGSATYHAMLCTKPAWDISQTYQPYRPSYQELYDKVETKNH